MKRFRLVHSVNRDADSPLDYDIYFHQLDKKNQWLDYRAVQARGGFASSLGSIQGAFPQEIDLDMQALLNGNKVEESMQPFELEQ